MKKLLADKRNIWYLCGILVGVAAIVIGFCFLQRKFYDPQYLDSIKFGADFYTEIYNANRRIHALLGNINDLIEYVKKGFGITFILAGAIDICVFGSKLRFCKIKSPAQEISSEKEKEDKTTSLDL